jgi:NADH:ubiquinone oxidoreductase subunit D
MYEAICNVRANHVTYEKGGVFKTPPKGYEKYFKKVIDKNVETASIPPKSEKRSKKDGR